MRDVITLDLLYLTCMVQMKNTGAWWCKEPVYLQPWYWLIFMPPAVRVRGIVFLSCRSIRPSVRPADKLIDPWLPRCQTNQVGPTNFPIHVSICLSISRGFCTFSSEHMGGMAWTLAWWCILMAYKLDWSFINVCWFRSFWCHFDLTKLIKCKVSRYFITMHGRNCLKCGMVIYLNHFKIWLDFSYGMLLILTLSPLGLR